MRPSSTASTRTTLIPGQLRRIHHLALNVKDMAASRHFYGGLLGLKELTGDEVDDTLKELVATGKVANFVTPDGLILDLFGAPNLGPPDPDPEKSFTRAYHLAFDIDPAEFDGALAVLAANEIAIAHGPVTRPTGRGVYFYDPDGFMIEIRCNPS
ncbi:MAG: VOC family protein [Cyanobacteria bacterium J06638_6]